MSRPNVKHTPLPADDLDDANVHLRMQTAGDGNDEQHSECESESRSRNSNSSEQDVRARRRAKQARKRKARESSVGQRDANANTFQQLHTLSFLPPPPRDTPPVGDTLSMQPQMAVDWPATLQRNQGHVYYPYASATLLRGNVQPDNNLYYLSSASKSCC